MLKNDLYFGGYRTRKQERVEYYQKYVHGRKLVQCGACMGSGKYDDGRGRNCSLCNGTGKTRE